MSDVTEAEEKMKGLLRRAGWVPAEEAHRLWAELAALQELEFKLAARLGEAERLLRLAEAMRGHCRDCGAPRLRKHYDDCAFAAFLALPTAPDEAP